MAKKSSDLERDALYKLRHSAAHVMAQAVMEMFPGQVRLGIGPPIEDGFYYDFDLPRPLTPEDLEGIEKRMRQIIGGKHPFLYRQLGAEEARAFFGDQPYKLELIAGLEAGGVDEYGEPLQETPVISTYRHDRFEDLCRGPHLDHTGQIPPDAFKLMNVAGAYWRGDENRPMLQRIYGTAWPNKQQLQAYLQRLEAAKQRDHRKVGKELDLFSVSSEAIGGGLILWHPNGAIIRHVIEEFCKVEHLKHGYVFAYTPHIGRARLWETSGHLEFYAEEMYAPLDIEGQAYYLRPMNCPFHANIFASQVRSYRELPIRMAEWGTVYRFERSGVLHGLARVRGFTQDDAHIFCRPDQMLVEIDRALNFCLHILRNFGFVEFNAYLSTRPEKAIGPQETWDAAEQALEKALLRAEIPYEVDEGGGAFYGPKIDLKMTDALDREWQLSTLQFDFNLPERFDLSYVGEDGRQHRPYMIHRALLGSMERFFAVLIEHYGGAFPVWLQPVQVVAIPITDRNNAYAQRVVERLQAAGLRASVDDGNDRMQAKVRNAQLQKVPYMLILGDREMENETVSVRKRDGQRQHGVRVDAFIAHVNQVVGARAIDL